MKHLGRLLTAFTWLLVAMSVVIIGGGLVGRPLLMAAVPTGSMVPALYPGDLIVVLPTWLVPPPAPGDIVVYRTERDRDWIVHRIVGGSAAEGFVTRGDANPTPDRPRVFPRDLAGVVPQWRGGALRLPRLGLLSIGQGPLANPAVAGVGLIIGIYLLVLDLHPRWRVPRLRRRPPRRTAPGAVLSLYLGLAGTAFLITLIPAWSLSTRQLLQYEIIASRHAQATGGARYLLGQAHRETVPIHNPSPLPLLVVLRAADPQVRFDPWWAVVPPGARHPFHASVDNPNLGLHVSSLEMGVFLPLLPPVWLAGIARRSLALAAVAVALIPALAVMALALLDSRTRLALARLRVRLATNYLA